MLVFGLATHFVQSAKLSLLEAALEKTDSSDPVVISSTISEFSEVPNLKEKSACYRLSIINKCFSQRSVQEIVAALEREAVDSEDDWISFSIKTLKKASPTSLKISLRSIREGRLQDIDQCFIREFRMICHVLRGEISRDFYEGCRAKLLEKDGNPKWEPSEIKLVTEEMVDRYFTKIDEDDWDDLILPVRSKVHASVIAKL